MAPETETDVPEGAPEPTSEEAEEQKQELSLEVKVDKPSACQRHVTVTVSRDDVERYYENQFDELMPDAEVPGFRKGRAPRKLVENKFRHHVTDQVKGRVLMDSIAQINEQHDFSAISEPEFDFDAIKVPDDGPMTFEFDLEVRPEFDMPEWKGIKIDMPTREFTKKDIDEHLKSLLSKYADLVPHDGPAEEGDSLTLRIRCQHDGKTVNSADEQTLRLRPNVSFRDATVKGFDKLLVGSRAGDKKQVEVTLTADADNEDLRGETVEVEFEVLDVKRLELPEIDEALLGRVGDFSSEEELRAAVEKELQRQLDYHKNREVREQITSVLTESADWELPPDLVKRQARRELERMVMELQSSGFTDEQIRAYENQLRQNSQSATETALKEHFILERIAEEENITDVEADYEKELTLLALQQNDTPRRVRARLEKRGLMDTLRNQIIERKTIDAITAKAKFKEVKFQLPTNDTEAIDLAIGGGRDESEIPEAKSGSGLAEPLRVPADHS